MYCKRALGLSRKLAASKYAQTNNENCEYAR